MKYDQQTYEQIEQYLAGQLQSSALEQFEQRMHEDKEFREMVQLQEHVDVALSDPGALELADALQDVDAEFFEEEQALPANEPTIRPLWQQRYYIAAAIMLLVLVGGSWLMFGGGANAEAVYAQFYETYEAPGNFRTDAPTLDEAYASAFRAYNAQDFTTAAQRFESIANSDATQLTARFFAAGSHLARGAAAQAIPLYEKLIAEPPHPYTTQSKWYRAMALLKTGDVEGAQAQLQGIAGQPGKYGGLATEALEGL